MRPVALLALVFGVLAQGILDGQTFTHAVFGVVCGFTAIGCGLESARKDRQRRLIGRVMAVLGIVLVFWCSILLPSAYRFQKKVNHRHGMTGHNMTGGIVGLTNFADTGDYVVLAATNSTNHRTLLSPELSVYDLNGTLNTNILRNQSLTN